MAIALQNGRRLLQLESNMVAMKAPSPLQELDSSTTHTILKQAEMDAAGNKPLMYNDSVQLTVRPSQTSFIEQKSQMFFVKQLDVGVLRCVASALGQSCALDFYSSKVDAALKVAQRANMGMMQTGVFRTPLNFKQIVGYCSLIHSFVISQLGLMDKNDLAWQYANYDKVVDMLGAEFELEKRIKHLQDKIEIVARDATTFVSFQQSDKSHMLEWTVIILIAMEIVVGLIDIWLHFTF